MEENVKVRWLTDHEQTKIAPKTLITQVLNENGSRFKDSFDATIAEMNESVEAGTRQIRDHANNAEIHVTQEEKDAWSSIEVPSLDNYATEEYVGTLFQKLASSLTLGFYCIEDVTISINGISTTYAAGSNVEIKMSKDDIWEIIPTSEKSILSLHAFPGALGTFYPWLEGVAQFSNILFDMNSEEFYSKWSQGNQGAYRVQFAQYTNCIFWSDNPYISDVAKRTNYTLCSTSQLPLCYSTIPDNTFKSFYLAFGVNSDPNWSNPVYKESFAKATWATQVFSYYGARVVGFPGHDNPDFLITLPKDCRGLMFDARNIECAGTFDAANVTNFGAKSGSWREAFGDCPSLRRLYIKNLKVNLNISWSPIDYDSISYIISSAANTNAITISVSPYTYNLLSPADFDLAASKNITIALLSTNYVEDKRLSEIAGKVDKTYVDTKITDLVNSAPETLDTLGELAAALEENQEVVDVLNASITNKQNKNVIVYRDSETKLASMTAAQIMEKVRAGENVYFTANLQGGTLHPYLEGSDTAVFFYSNYIDNDKAMGTGIVVSANGTITTETFKLAHLTDNTIHITSTERNRWNDTYTKAETDDLLEAKANGENVLLKTEQVLTDEELAQVKNNLRYIGKGVGGTEVTPYNIEELDYGTDNHRIEETPLDPVTASEGAEVFNLYDGMNVASGAYSTAMGHHTVASGDYAVSQGRWTTASGFASRSSGLLTYATGHYSTAEGTRNKATKNDAHAEGNSTTASGNASHAEGQSTVASTHYAHAEGWKTQATGIAAHAEGEGTIAKKRAQTAMGKWNVADSDSWLIVGKGTGDTDRSNAFRVSSTGQGYFASDVYANDSKKLATEEFVTTSVENKQDKITDTLMLADAVTGAKYKLQIQNGQLVTSLIEEE